MGVLFPISLDFGQFFDDFITVFSVLAIASTFFDPMQTLKVNRTYTK